MANIRKGTNKDGKPVYYIRVSAGLGADGRYIYRSDTFTPPPGLTARQREKAARQYAEEFEQRVKEGGLCCPEYDGRRPCRKVDERILRDAAKGAYHTRV